MDIDRLTRALTNFPATLHADVLTASAASGSLFANHDAADKVLPLLPLISVPSPGLLRFFLHPHNYRRTLTPFFDRASTGALLARSISAHPSLTSLSLSRTPLTTSWLRSFAACLAPGALPALANLTLGADVHPGGCAEVAACLRLLLSLTSLNISFILPRKPITDALPLGSYANLRGDRVSLPRLRSVDYVEWRRGSEETAASSDSRAACFLSLLNADSLKRLRMKLCTPLPMQPLQTQVARFSTLEGIFINACAPVKKWGASPRLQETLQLRRVSSITVNVGGDALIASAALAAPIVDLASSAVTDVSVTHEGMCAEGQLQLLRGSAAGGNQPGQSDVDLKAMTHAHSHLFQALGRCTGLTSLSLQCICSPAAATDQLAYSTAVAASIERMSQLTYLQLSPPEGADVKLAARPMTSAISSLPALSWLLLDSVDGLLTFTPVEDFFDACAQLLKVPRLDLLCEGVTAARVVSMLQRMTTLRHLEVGGGVFDDMDEDELEDLQEDFDGVLALRC